jgi:hypothetical protein
MMLLALITRAFRHAIRQYDFEKIVRRPHRGSAQP